MGASPVTSLRGDRADFLQIGKSIAPGIATVEVVREHDFDAKKPGGADAKKSGKITTNGEKFADVKVTLTIYEGDPDEHDLAIANGETHIETEIDRMWFLIDSLFPEGKPATPFDVSHPKFTLHRIRSVLFTKLDGPKDIDVGVWQIVLSGKAFRPALPTATSATSTASSSKPLGGSAAAAAGAAGGAGGTVPQGFNYDAFEKWRTEQLAASAKWKDAEEKFLFGLGPDPGPVPVIPQPPEGFGTPHPNDPAGEVPRP